MNPPVKLKGMHECLGAAQNHPIQVVSIQDAPYPWSLLANLDVITKGAVPGFFMIDVHYCPFCGRDLFEVDVDEKLKSLFSDASN